ncbi:GHKL domain-containing protein [Heliobacterium undosum]|uniref:histidine kinase n=1 Tax=Heliomicrobium undosum TaxID=121734 RepID=A0A845L6K0_9FIRM|nr:ATP-binding protein [Heliomicrobium undosum]MZP30290.1 GHKL domain-containing protein [Heliomicrobium undosum]
MRDIEMDSRRDVSIGMPEDSRARKPQREVLEWDEQAERMASLGRIATGIAHEINQPLNSLKVIADSMLYWHRKGKPADIEKIMENVSRISAQADRINDIIQHIRTFVRNQTPVDPRPCQVNVAVEGALALLGSQLSSHGIVVKTCLDPSLTQILAVSNRLEEVIINLVVNAMHALDSVERLEKRICISTRQAGSRVILEVEDNGCGIGEELRGRIFEPFFTTKPIEGMGLGLSIVHSVVTSFQGCIDTVANADCGATFRVTFPTYAGHAGEGAQG